MKSKIFNSEKRKVLERAFSIILSEIIGSYDVHRDVSVISVMNDVQESLGALLLLDSGDMKISFNTKEELVMRKKIPRPGPGQSEIGWEVRYEMLEEIKRDIKNRHGCEISMEDVQEVVFALAKLGYCEYEDKINPTRKEW